MARSRTGLVAASSGSAEQDGHQGVDEQRLAHQGLGARREVEGVEPHPRGPEVEVGTADRFGQAPVLVLGVDHRHLDAGVQAAQRLELGQVGLARTRTGQDDRVVVVLGEAVPQHQSRSLGRRAVEDAGGGRQLGRGEGERGSQGVGVEAAPERQGIDAQGQRGDPPLQAPPGGGLGIEQHRGAQRSHPGALGVERCFARRMHRQVQPDPEQLLLAPGQTRRQLPGVEGRHLDLGIAKTPFGRIGPPARLEAGQLAPQPVGGDLGGDRLDVHRDVETTGMAGERLQPSERHLPRVADDGEAPAPAVADPERPGTDLDAVGTERRRRTTGRRRAAADDRMHGSTHDRSRVHLRRSRQSPLRRVTTSTAAHRGRSAGRCAAGSRARDRQRRAASPPRTSRVTPAAASAARRLLGPAAKPSCGTVAEPVDAAPAAPRGAAGREWRPGRRGTARVRGPPPPGPGAGRPGATRSSSAMAGARSNGSARISTWAGSASEFRYRPNPATRASCSAGVRKEKDTAEARHMTANPSGPRSTSPSSPMPTMGRRSGDRQGVRPTSADELRDTGTPSGAGTSRRGERCWRQAASTSRSADIPPMRPRASNAATPANGAATAAKTATGTRCRVAS